MIEREGAGHRRGDPARERRRRPRLRHAVARRRRHPRAARLICNLPGSSNGAREGLAVLLPIAGHALDLLAAVVRTRPRTQRDRSMSTGDACRRRGGDRAAAGCVLGDPPVVRRRAVASKWQGGAAFAVRVRSRAHARTEPRPHRGRPCSGVGVYEVIDHGSGQRPASDSRRRRRLRGRSPYSIPGPSASQSASLIVSLRATERERLGEGSREVVLPLPGRPVTITNTGRVRHGPRLNTLQFLGRLGNLSVQYNTTEPSGLGESPDRR